jgi:hypothetical protein
MMNPKALRRIAIILMAAATALAAASQEVSPDYYAVGERTDWEGRSLDISIDLDLVKAGLRLPSGRGEAERMIERDLPLILKEAVLGLPVDSRRSVEACIDDGTLVPDDLLGLADDVVPGTAAFSKNLRLFHADYSLPLEAVAALFIHHRTALLPDAPLEYRPTRDFTGIVIYAQGPLPVHGERATEALRPCLFPRIYDETMKVLLERNTVAPESLAAWGELGYATSLDAAARRRVGDDPIRVDATAFFGTDRTDILLSQEDALKILASPANRGLLAAGRVIVIVSPASLAPAAATDGSDNGAEGGT